MFQLYDLQSFHLVLVFKEPIFFPEAKKQDCDN